MNPTELGFSEKRPGSGIWYHPDKNNGQRAYEPKICEGCGLDFMGLRSGQRFHSEACAGLFSRKVEPGYHARHDRVKYKLGSANGYPCTDGCDNQAYDWSQTHGTTGLEIEHYAPRCRPCHRAYDGAAQGERHGAARLTAVRVRGILASVGATGKELAEIHGVSPSTISLIRLRKVWRHIK